MARWFYYDGIRKVGPISSSELKMLAELGQIGVGTIVETEEGKQTIARNIRGLFERPAAPALDTPSTGTPPADAFPTSPPALSEKTLPPIPDFPSDMFTELHAEPDLKSRPAPPVSGPQPPLPPRAPFSGELSPIGAGTTLGLGPAPAPVSTPAPGLAGPPSAPVLPPFPALNRRVLWFLVRIWNVIWFVVTGAVTLFQIRCLVDVFRTNGLVPMWPLLVMWLFSTCMFLLGLLLLYLLGQGLRTWLKWDHYLTLKIENEKREVPFFRNTDPEGDLR